MVTTFNLVVAVEAAQHLRIFEPGFGWRHAQELLPCFDRLREALIVI
jgi:hypothetical protein